MTIPQIEKEFNEPIDKVLSDLLREDYMGCAMLRPYQVANLFRTSCGVINSIIEKYNIKYDKALHFPTRTEDTCWVKFDVSLGFYLRTRSRYLTENEMAIQLEVSRQEITKLIKKYNIPRRRLVRCLWEI